MGSTSLEGMVEYGTFEQALRWNLEHNHFPPVGFMFETCKKAIGYAKKGKYDTLVNLPNGVEHRRYGKRAPVHVIIESYHLDPFLP